MRAETESPRFDFPPSAPTRKALATRSVQSELLDQLPPTDARAVHSRRDLKRVNWWMGNAAILAAAVKDLRPHRIVELGAGDGTLLLDIANKIAPAWSGTEAILLDQHPIVDQETLQRLSAMGLRPRMETADALDWLKHAPSNSCDLILTNLFLHHFREADLTSLMHAAARVTSFLVAAEPRRNRQALASCQLLRLIGCNAITLHDAAVSVRAGFRGDELTRTWPAGDWILCEQPAGLFSHLFIAAKKR
jgi:hypothetical protein